MSPPPTTPAELARETLILLAKRKIPPTPDNYAKIYAEISGTQPLSDSEPENILLVIADQLTQSPQSAPVGIELKKALTEKNWKHYLQKIGSLLSKQSIEPSHPWSSLIGDLIRQLETSHKGLTIARKKEGVDIVLKRFSTNPEALFEKLNALIRSWSEAPKLNSIETDVASEPPAENAPAIADTLPARPLSVASDVISQLGELLAQSLEHALSTQPELITDAQILIQQIRASNTSEHVAELKKSLRQFWIKYEIRTGDKTKVHEGLLRLLRLLVENISEMVEGEDWIHGQVATLQEIISSPFDRNVIADAERSLRDTIINQGLLKKSLTDAKSTLKNLMSSFIARLNEITESTGEYHQKLEGYSQKIGNTDNLIDLSHLLGDIMQDTRIIQASALRSHEELVNTRQQVQQAEEEIQNLQQELAQVSELIREDQLTGALNRRGLDAAFENESARADRYKSQLCVALLDIDNFKRLNDSFGHQTGDHALIHLSSVIKEALRPSDSVARYGGEEFVILLPNTDLESAASTMERLQRELTKKYFMHENDRVLITFSAGVAQRAPQESQEEVIGRADKAMYQAKMAGKNRVIMSK